jgi:hypothetical protein
VANISQGVTVAWGTSLTILEVVSVSVDGVSSDSVEVTPRTSTDRGKVYSAADVDLGTVSVTARDAKGMTTTNVGLTQTLSITGPNVSFSFSKAIFQSLGWTAAVGEMQTYTATFKIGK